MYGETTFGPWLRQRRRQLDLTQADLARQVNCSEITVRKLEADERTPSRQIAELLADCLEVPAAERPAFVAFARGRTGAGALGPPLSPPSAPPGGLPAPLTRLLGRDQEVARICQCLLDDTRLLTLIGPPGIGKTRLSLSIAGALSDRFPDGAVFVALASVADPGLVVDALAQAVGVAEAAGHSIGDRLIEALCDRSMLLVLDNFEHVLPAAGEIARLLAACPELKVLATSRAALHIRGEQLFPVSPLALPTMAWPLEAQTVARSSAVMLFVERAQAAASNFALSDENAATVAAICARLDGLPLAIELVAARMRLLSPLALLSRLGQRLDLLAAGPSDLPPRHQTLRRAIEWSYNLLAPDEQRLFERLGVLAGDYELEAIEAICGDCGLQIADCRLEESGQSTIYNLQSTILESLEVLIDHSLVARRAGADEEPRCVMLETIREYALERLAASGQLPALRERHARYYLALAERAEPELSGAQQERWLNRLEREHDQFHAALSWAQEAGAAEIGRRLAAVLWRFACQRLEIRDWRLGRYEQSLISNL
jgi:predicted ATPase/transcriptional regulator with XRE-family HTH domain